ncbi:MAG: biotin/lipoyl-containing protein [Candidatus Bipolaricaulia bacterium]
MSWVVEIEDRTLEVALDEIDGQLWASWGDEERFPIDLHPHPNSDLYTLEIGNRRETIWMGRRDGGLQIHWNGRTFDVQAETAHVHELRRWLHEHGATTGADVPVEAVMPGVVTEVMVEEGQAVEAEDGLVVVDAMKMENEIRAPAGGVISDLAVEANQEVQRGQRLCLIQPPESADGGDADGE